MSDETTLVPFGDVRMTVKQLDAVVPQDAPFPEFRAQDQLRAAREEIERLTEEVFDLSRENELHRTNSRTNIEQFVRIRREWQSRAEKAESAQAIAEGKFQDMEARYYFLEQQLEAITKQRDSIMARFAIHVSGCKP